MTAEEARNITENSRGSRVKPILLKIKSAAEKGDNEVCWYDSITDKERQCLSDLGYNVGKSDYDPRDHTSFTWIKW